LLILNNCFMRKAMKNLARGLKQFKINCGVKNPIMEVTDSTNLIITVCVL
jgi:hypothetical protein